MSARLRGPPVLGLILVMAVVTCSRDGVTPIPLEPDATGPLATQSQESPLLPSLSGANPAGPSSLTPTELLADPLLLSLMESLQDRARAQGLSALIETLKNNLYSEDQAAIAASLEGVFFALGEYVRAEGVTDEDVLHLDAVELILDEVERMTDSGQTNANKR